MSTVVSPRSVTDAVSASAGQDPSMTKKAASKDTIPSKGEVQAVIPAHCFERSILHGFLHIARDCAVIAAFAATAYLCLDPVRPSITDPVAFLTWAIGWSIYAFWQVLF